MTEALLKDLIEYSRDGEWGPVEPADRHTPMRVIRGTDFDSVRAGEVSGLPIRYIPDRKATQKELRAGDVLVETAGGTATRPTGRSVLVRPDYIEASDLPLCCASFARFVRVNRELVDPAYLQLWLENSWNERDLLRFNTQHTGVARFQWTTCAETTSVPLPTLDVQERLVEPFLVIDDLVTNNRRRVELLEQMAQAIYREWFVHFRYPGHRGDDLVDSDLGPIPEGWAVEPLVAVARLTMGQSPSSEHYNEEGIGRPFHQGVKDFGSHVPTNRVYCSVGGREADDGDVLISVRAPVGRLNLADGDIIIGRGLAAAHARSGRQGLLFRTLKDVVFAEEDSMGGGTIFKAIGKKDLEQIPVITAPPEIEDAADNLLSDIVTSIKTLTLANRRLAAIRDLLLPKLVTGQIDVSDLDLDALVGAAGA